jgi:chorismate mutase
MMSLDDIRNKIDIVDEEIVRLLNQRAEYAREIGMKKSEAGLPVQDKGREESVLSRVAKASNGPLSSESIKAIYRKIIDGCLEVQDNEVLSDSE